jgi:hypothetical protein
MCIASNGVKVSVTGAQYIRAVCHADSALLVLVPVRKLNFQSKAKGSTKYHLKKILLDMN